MCHVKNCVTGRLTQWLHRLDGVWIGLFFPFSLSLFSSFSCTPRRFFFVKEQKSQLSPQCRSGLNNVPNVGHCMGLSRLNKLFCRWHFATTPPPGCICTVHKYNRFSVFMLQVRNIFLGVRTEWTGTVCSRHYATAPGNSSCFVGDLKFKKRRLPCRCKVANTADDMNLVSAETEVHTFWLWHSIYSVNFMFVVKGHHALPTCWTAAERRYIV